ncbi:hypothetical protein [Leifsonia shinshuensis]|uniref:ABC transporter permease n=1 Tax=Leifsonia shinshuensis TaxID=150026 RepID=A0A853CY30_9MICO|nr:hypothetical protein [Leifsonia shinshuensis]NYJ24823.1 hypothetical protein [Leifsonia shinshuensis]
MTGAGMRFTEVRREAARNIATGTSRAVLLAALIAVVSGVLAGLDAIAMNGVITRADEFRERGASITILTVEDGIDGRLCDALASQHGVRAAGALKPEATPLSVAGVPGNPLPSFTASPGFSAMLPESSGRAASGLLLPRTVAETLGLRTGDPIHTADGPTRLGGTFEYPDDGRSRGLGYAAIAPTSPDTPFDQCWMDAFPVSRATTELLYTTIAANSIVADTAPKLSQHNTVLGVAIDPAEAYRTRTAVAFSAAGLILGSFAGFVAVWARRLEIASALHSGVRKRDQAATLLLETLAWSTAGAVTTIPVIAVLTSGLAAADHLPVVLTASSTPVLTVSGAVLGALVAALAIREQRLFSYFKGR